jgi:hypothetical protein
MRIALALVLGVGAVGLATDATAHAASKIYYGGQNQKACNQADDLVKDEAECKAAMAVFGFKWWKSFTDPRNPCGCQYWPKMSLFGFNADTKYCDPAKFSDNTRLYNLKSSRMSAICKVPTPAPSAQGPKISKSCDACVDAMSKSKVGRQSCNCHEAKTFSTVDDKAPLVWACNAASPRYKPCIVSQKLYADRMGGQFGVDDAPKSAEWWAETEQRLGFSPETSQSSP